MVGRISADVFVVKVKCYNCLQEYAFDQFFIILLMLTQLIAIGIMSKLMVWRFHLVHIP